MKYEQLKLKNQLCFPVYAASRLIIREYQPYLDRLGITYTQYLVLMVLWETDSITVNDVSEKLILNTNTVTPLLKRLETLKLIRRNRSEFDERKVIVQLTGKGRKLKKKAAGIPAKMEEGLFRRSLKLKDMEVLREKIDLVIDSLAEKKDPVLPQKAKQHLKKARHKTLAISHYYKDMI